MDTGYSSRWLQSGDARPQGTPRISRSLLFAVVVLFMIMVTTLEGAWLRASRGEPIDWTWLMLGRAAAWATCACFVPALYALTVRLPVTKESWRLAVPLHAAASLAASLGKYLLYLPLAVALDPTVAGRWEAILRSGFLGEVMFYWAVIGFAHALVFHDRQTRERSARTVATLPREPVPAPVAPSPFDHADWIEAQGNYVLVHGPLGKRMVRQTLSSLESILPPGFLRVHRSAIVNMDRVTRILPGPRGTWRFFLPGGEAIDSGRAYAARLRQALPAR